MLRPLALACLLITPLGCMTSSVRYVTRSTGQQEIMMDSGRGLPSIMGDFTAEPGLVRGHVAWTSDCRRVIVDEQVKEQINVNKPNRGAGFAATVIGAGIGALGIGAISSADSLSDEQSCSTNLDGSYSCSSPRQNAIGWGAVGVITGALLVGTGLVTLVARPQTNAVSTETAPPVISRVTQEHVSCGEQPVRGLGLSLTRAGIQVAASSTNEEGDVAFAVPETVSGGLVVVVDAVPPPLANIRVGEIVGSVEIVPKVTGAESDDRTKHDAATTKKASP